MRWAPFGSRLGFGSILRLPGGVEWVPLPSASDPVAVPATAPEFAAPLVRSEPALASEPAVGVPDFASTHSAATIAISETRQLGDDPASRNGGASARAVSPRTWCWRGVTGESRGSERSM